MKKVFKMCFVALLCVGFYSCNSGGDSPETVAENYLKEFYKGNYDACKPYVTKESEEVLNQFKVYADAERQELMKDAEITFKNAKCDVDGENATYYSDVVIKSNDEEETDAMTIPLIKENGEWKVVVKKE